MFTRIDARLDAIVTSLPAKCDLSWKPDRTSSVVTSLGWETTLTRTPPSRDDFLEWTSVHSNSQGFRHYSAHGHPERLNLSVSAAAGQLGFHGGAANDGSRSVSELP